MVSNKDRLYVGLYARAGAARMPGKEDMYAVDNRSNRIGGRLTISEAITGH